MSWPKIIVGRLTLRKRRIGRVPGKCSLVFGSYVRNPIAYVKYFDSGYSMVSYGMLKTSNHQLVCAIDKHFRFNGET